MELSFNKPVFYVREEVRFPLICVQSTVINSTNVNDVLLVDLVSTPLGSASIRKLHVPSVLQKEIKQIFCRVGLHTIVRRTLGWFIISYHYYFRQRQYVITEQYIKATFLHLPFSVHVAN